MYQRRIRRRFQDWMLKDGSSETLGRTARIALPSHPHTLIR